jgi:hypothetical protein
MTPTPTPARRRRSPVLLVATALAVLLTGCGGAPEEIGPTGIDGLEIPTPSPRTDDFVAQVDNPWLPLRPGTAWGYRVDDGPVVARRVTVTDGTRVVAGVRTTVVRVVESSRAGRPLTDTYAWYAEDRDGNVWLFGEDVQTFDRGGGTTREGKRLSWEAGVGGAEAGLAMPAAPRVGDGYRQELLTGVAEDRAEVLALDETLEVSGTAYDDLLVTEVTTPLAPGLVVRRYYSEGTGLVHEETVAGGDGEVDLVRFSSP